MRRLEGLKWENSSSLFIMLNDTGTILPIFKTPADIPLCISMFYNNYPSFKQDIVAFEKLSP